MKNKLVEWLNGWSKSQITFMAVLVGLCLALAVYCADKCGRAIKSANYWHGVAVQVRGLMLIGFILCFALATEPLMAQGTNNPSASKESHGPAFGIGYVIGGIVLAIGGTAVYCIVKVCGKLPSDKGTVTLILEKSPDHATWMPIATNTVTLNGQEPIEIFSEVIRKDQNAFYRTRRIQ